MPNFFRPKHELRDLTLEDLLKAFDAAVAWEPPQPAHLLYGDRWCSVCGPRELWAHGHTNDEQPRQG